MNHISETVEYLHVRQRNKVIKVGVILAAEVTIAASFYALFRMPGGYLDRHRTEIIPVVETERTVQGSQMPQTQSSQAVPANQMTQTQGGQAVPENQIPQTQGNQAVLANQTPQTQENQPMQEQDSQTPQAG